ncbi:hypothetical protein [Actinomycetospora sp. TBRC 11914]|uniref:hypothetical protein n=1 Tax=Actinomycetospora sp. TBRC 11914 TaxID=2729387 RepID=UPI002007080A|nr:hypothetical protein [Actinomycetospora sp. TBRC 11914]
MRARTAWQGVAVAVLALDAALLAWTEVAWLSLRVGTVPVPVSVLVAAVTTPLLVVAADRVRPGTRVAFVPLVVWLLVVVVPGLWSPAGPGMFPTDWRGIALVGAGLLPSAWAAARPARVPRAPADTAAGPGA